MRNFRLGKYLPNDYGAELATKQHYTLNITQKRKKIFEITTLNLADVRDNTTVRNKVERTMDTNTRLPRATSTRE